MIPARIKIILDDNNLTALEFEEGSTPNSVTAAAKIGVEVGQIAKSLLFKGRDGRFFMIVCAGDCRTSSKKMKILTGIQTRMARPGELMDITGFKPGEVCPFGITKAEVFLDESLKAWKTIYPAAGTDSSGVPLTYERLMEITGAAACDVAEE